MNFVVRYQEVDWDNPQPFQAPPFVREFEREEHALLFANNLDKEKYMVLQVQTLEDYRSGNYKDIRSNQ